MLDASKYAQGEGQAFFKPKDVKGQSCKVTVKGFREMKLQYSGESLIIDFDYKKEERSIPLNVTNTRAMIEMYGSDAEQWVGHEIKLVKVMANNPKLKKEVESWRIRRAEKEVKTEKVKG